ncbi:MAG: hypothetical protein GY711_26430 [bacterium]|nr:hypothetical protein [bacterium]
MRHHVTLRVLAALALFVSSSCAIAYKDSIPDVAPEINATFSSARSTIRPGDTLKVAFPAEPDWTHETGVRDDGRATFLGVDDFPAAGMTLTQLDASLTHAYGQVMNQAPTLTVSISNPVPGTVSVMGEVGNPGVFAIGPSGRMTLLEAFAAAGGPTTNTSHLGKTLIVRWLPEEQRHHVWKVDARRKHWKQNENILMAPGDVVFVPNTPIDKVGIWIDMWIRRLIPFPRVFVGAA